MPFSISVVYNSICFSALLQAKYSSSLYVKMVCSNDRSFFNRSIYFGIHKMLQDFLLYYPSEEAIIVICCFITIPNSRKATVVMSSSRRTCAVIPMYHCTVQQTELGIYINVDSKMLRTANGRFE